MNCSPGGDSASKPRAGSALSPPRTSSGNSPRGGGGDASSRQPRPGGTPVAKTGKDASLPSDWDPMRDDYENPEFNSYNTGQAQNIPKGYHAPGESQYVFPFMLVPDDFFMFSRLPVIKPVDLYIHKSCLK